MKEMLQRIMDNAGKNALISAKAFEKAASELGYSNEEIIAAIREFDGFPLDDDDLMDITGGTMYEGGWGGNITPNIM